MNTKVADLHETKRNRKKTEQDFKGQSEQSVKIVHVFRKNCR